MKKTRHGVLFTALTLVLGLVVLTTTIAAPQLRLVQFVSSEKNARQEQKNAQSQSTVDATAQTITGAAAGAQAAPTQQAALQSPAMISAQAPRFVREPGDNTSASLGTLWEHDKDKSADNKPTSNLTEKFDGDWDLDILSSVYDNSFSPGSNKPLPWDDPNEGKDRIVVPGTHGFYNFTVRAIEDCEYEFDILLSDNLTFTVDGKEITVAKWADLPLRYRLWNVATEELLTAVPDNPGTGETSMNAGKDDWVGVDVDGLEDLDNAYGLLAKGKSCEYRLDWKWPYETKNGTDLLDAEDTALGKMVYAEELEDIPYYRLKLALVMWAQNIGTDELIQIYFDPDYPGAAVTTRTYNLGDQFGNTLPEITRDGWVLVGWFEKDKDGNLIDQATAGTYVSSVGIGSDGKRTLYAKWVQKSEESKVWVNYDPNGEGATVTPARWEYDINDTLGSWSTIGALPVPVRSGYRFTGWVDKNGNPISADTLVSSLERDENGEITVYATWQEESKVWVNYNPNGEGATVSPARWEYDISDALGSWSTIGALPVPVRNGYRFTGWVDKNGNPISADTLVSSLERDENGEITVYATWQEENTELPWWIWALPPVIAAPLIPLIGAAVLLPSIPVVLGGLGLIGLGGLGRLGVLGGLGGLGVLDCWLCLLPFDECICEGKCLNPECRTEIEDATDDQNKPPVMPPKTGDSSATIWAAMTMLALSGGAAILLSRKRREETV